MQYHLPFLTNTISDSLNIQVFTNQLDRLQHFKFGTKVIQKPLKDNIDCKISDSVILSENFAYVYQ